LGALQTRLNTSEGMVEQAKLKATAANSDLTVVKNMVKDIEARQGQAEERIKAVEGST
jgi:hypothetical protein